MGRILITDGYLIKDAEVKKSKNGNDFVSMAISTWNSMDGKDANGRRNSQIVNITCYLPHVVTLARNNSLKKGKPIYVCGNADPLTTYADSNGVHKSTYTMTASMLNFVEYGGERQNQLDGQTYQPVQGQVYAPQQQMAQPYAQQPQAMPQQQMAQPYAQQPQAMPQQQMAQPYAQQPQAMPQQQMAQPYAQQPQAMPQQQISPQTMDVINQFMASNPDFVPQQGVGGDDIPF